ncbi:MAG: phosphohistidine phosphatase SixA [Gammaproteobacteria bacterium]|nr:phosphohistidine phosphatase SixA [Gammaproteobacteria bacterium]
MLTIYLVQHGVALEKDVDATRPLSDIGIEETTQIAATLLKQGIIINKIVHSGKLRAHQTASIFAEVMNISQISEMSGMKPNDNPDELIEQMTEDGVMYVGHLPNVQIVASNLVGNGQNSGVFQFKNSAVACIEIHEDNNSIKWFLTPELCTSF